MKGQSNTKVAAEMVRPSLGAESSPADLETLQDAQEAAAATEKFERKKNADMGKVAQLLGAAVKITDWTFPFLTMQGRQLAVSEWYPDLLIVVDKFYQYGDEQEKEVEFKMEAFAGNKVNGKAVRYGFLTPSMELYDLAEQLGLVEAGA